MRNKRRAYIGFVALLVLALMGWLLSGCISGCNPDEVGAQAVRLGQYGPGVVHGDWYIDDELYVDGTTNLDDLDIDLSAEFEIDGALTDIGGGTGGTADGDNDLLVAGDLEVDDTLDVDGDIDLNGDGFDVDITAAFSIDGDAASNINVAGAGIDLTLESEAGRLVLKGDEAAADGIYIDANDAVTTGLSIVVGSVSGLSIDGGLTDIGGGTYATANGDNDLGVNGDLEVNGVLDADSTMTLASTFTQENGDVIVADDIRVTAQTAITVTNAAVFTATGTYQGIQAAGEVTPTIAAGTAGDLLVLINVGSQTINIADTGTQMLTTAWAAGQYDVLVLWSDGTNWLEISRANN